jgi:hypothetical protein
VNGARRVAEPRQRRRQFYVLEHAFEWQAAFRDQLVQWASVDVLHDDGRVAVDFGDLVNRADVRMIERRRGARLLEELRGGQLW